MTFFWADETKGKSMNLERPWSWVWWVPSMREEQRDEEEEEGLSLKEGEEEGRERL